MALTRSSLLIESRPFAYMFSCFESDSIKPGCFFNPRLRGHIYNTSFDELLSRGLAHFAQTPAGLHFNAARKVQ